MFCSKPYCNLSSSDLFVSCWLCNVIYHAKCVNLSPRTADNLREDKGVRWCCTKCKVYDIKFFTFIKSTLSEIDDISNDLSLLTDKFKKYRELFDKVSCLNKYIDSPAKSPKRKKTSEPISNIVVASDPIAPRNNYNNIPVDHHPVPVTTFQTMDLNVIQNEKIPVSNNNLLDAIPPRSKPPHLNVTSSGSNTFFSPINSPITQKSPSLNPNDNNGPKQLKVVSMKKTIFAARFAAETTEEDIDFYIKSKINADININVFKFKYTQQRSKSSFKIIVPEEVFETIVNADFWPPKAIIHEYVYRENIQSDIVHLPARNLSKN